MWLDLPQKKLGMENFALQLLLLPFQNYTLIGDGEDRHV